MRIPLVLLLVLNLGARAWSQQLASANAAEMPTRFSMAEEAQIRARLAGMDCIIDRRDHPTVESYLRGYMLRNYRTTEVVLGRIPAYFPLFERLLAEEGLPDGLKYLAVVESALEPRALSRTGAGGLWQFMPTTARVYGLRIDERIDERAEPEKATRAAIAYLKEEYARFGDWSLVLASYNCGPGRVRRAIRRSGSKDFWKLSKYLPRETRNYVPAFVAATYLHTYGYLHGVNARETNPDLTLTEQVACPGGITFAEVAQATGLPLADVRLLNAQCIGGVLPAAEGASVRVPARVAPSLRTYLNWDDEGRGDLLQQVRKRPVLEDEDEGAAPRYYPQTVELTAGSSLDSFARAEGVSVHHLQAWNPGLPKTSDAARRVVVYRPRYVPRSPLELDEEPGVDLLMLPTRGVALADAGFYTLPKLPRRSPNATRRLGHYESLVDVWRGYRKTMSWREFTAWNGIDDYSHPKVGALLLVRQ